MIRFLQTPSRMKKIVLGAVLLFIIVAMVVTLIPGWGTDTFGAGSTPGVYARVGDQTITSIEVQRGAERAAQRRGFPAQFVPFLLPQVADELVNEKALLAEARRLGLRVTDAELKEDVERGSISQFFPKDQALTRKALEDFAANANMTVPQLERAFKDMLLSRKVMALVAGSVTASDAEVQKEFERQNVKVKFDYALLNTDTLMKQVQPGEAELRKFFQANQARFKDAIPERRKLRYVVLDTGRVAPQAQVTPEDLLRYYNQHKDEFRVSDEVNVRHILVKTPPPGPDGKPDQKGVDAARAKAEGLLKQLNAGADFAALAKKDSGDPGSGANGGSLGWVGRGRTVAEFEKTAFSLQKGQLSGLVQTQFGFHILKLDDKRNAHVQTLEEVRARIEPVVAQEKARDAAKDLASKVATQARSNGFDAAAAQNGLNVVTTDFVSRNDSLPGIGPSPEFMTAVFAAAKAAPAVTPAGPGFVVYEVREVQPPATPTFEQVRAQLEVQYRGERAEALLDQKTRELSDRARALHNLKQAARELGAEYKTSELVGMESQIPDIGQMANAEAAFEMKPGEISGPIAAGRNGVVLLLVQRQEPSPAALQAARDQVRESVLQQKKQQAMALFVSNARARMEKDGAIKYNKEERERLTRPRTPAGG